MDRPRYEYLIDQDDVITGVNGEWRMFARENTASDLPHRVRTPGRC